MAFINQIRLGTLRLGLPLPVRQDLFGPVATFFILLNHASPAITQLQRDTTRRCDGELCQAYEIDNAARHFFTLMITKGDPDTRRIDHNFTAALTVADAVDAWFPQYGVRVSCASTFCRSDDKNWNVARQLVGGPIMAPTMTASLRAEHQCQGTVTVTHGPVTHMPPLLRIRVEENTFAPVDFPRQLLIQGRSYNQLGLLLFLPGHFIAVFYLGDTCLIHDAMQRPTCRILRAHNLEDDNLFREGMVVEALYVLNE